MGVYHFNCRVTGTKEFFHAAVCVLTPLPSWWHHGQQTGSADADDHAFLYHLQYFSCRVFTLIEISIPAQRFMCWHLLLRL
jgi:hypothetical protein